MTIDTEQLGEEMRLRPKCVTSLTSESDIRAGFLNLSCLNLGEIMIVPVSQSEGAPHPSATVTMVRSRFPARFRKRLSTVTVTLTLARNASLALVILKR